MWNCKQNNWIYRANTYQWALSPSPHSSDACSVLFIYSETYTTGGNDAYRPHAIKPVLYLKPEVQITGGVGTLQNPFTLSLN